MLDSKAKQIDDTLDMMSRSDQQEVHRLLASDDIEEWKRSFQPIDKYKKIVKTINFHVIGTMVHCYVEGHH